MKICECCIKEEECKETKDCTKTMKGDYEMDKRERESLDRYITGNYGEDRFQEEPRMTYTLRRNMNE